MQTEIEAKFLRVDVSDVRHRLEDAGAVCEQPMREMRRAIIDYPDRRLQTQLNSFIRVRDEGDKITLTLKQVNEDVVSGAREIEVQIDDFHRTIELFEFIGLTAESIQESRRETWSINSCEVVIDEWPWIEPYIEIEGPTEKAIQDAAKELGMPWETAVFGSATVAYKNQYPGIGAGESISMIPLIRFGADLPEWLKDRQK